MRISDLHGRMQELTINATVNLGPDPCTKITLASWHLHVSCISATCLHNMLGFIIVGFALCFLVQNVFASDQWINYPDSGHATLTHYTLTSGYIASCGCTGASTDYPTAALSQMAYGSSVNYGICLISLSQKKFSWLLFSPGPGCGRCFKLTLVNPIIATPPFHPDVTKSIFVKITDLCPLSTTGWCSGTKTKPNSYDLFQLSFSAETSSSYEQRRGLP